MQRSRSFSILEIVALLPRLKKSRGLAWSVEPSADQDFFRHAPPMALSMSMIRVFSMYSTVS
jgi:hypothetical protein